MVKEKERDEKFNGKVKGRGRKVSPQFRLLATSLHRISAAACL